VKEDSMLPSLRRTIFRDRLGASRLPSPGSALRGLDPAGALKGNELLPERGEWWVLDPSNPAAIEGAKLSVNLGPSKPAISSSPL